MNSLLRDSRIPLWYSSTLILLLSLICAGTGLAQRKVLSLNDVSTLLQAGVSSTRIVQLIEQSGVNFEFDDQASRRLKQEGADNAVINGLQRASARYVLEGQRQRDLIAAENKRKLEQERRIAEEKQKVEEAKRQQEDEALQRAEIERQQREKAEALERQARDKKRKADEEAARRAEAEKLRKQEEAYNRELELAKKQKAAELEKARLDPKSAVANLPSCSVGLRHVFQYEDGGQFTRRIDRLDGGLCVVGRFYYDSAWMLVKQIGRDGAEITSAQPEYPLVGEKWLPFPLTMGKEWQLNYRRRYATGGRTGSFANFFEVVGIEKIKTRAGSFDSFKIKHEQRQGGVRSGVRYLWYAPDAEYYVKHEAARQESNDPGYWADSVRSYELVSLIRPKK